MRRSRRGGLPADQAEGLVSAVFDQGACNWALDAPATCTEDRQCQECPGGPMDDGLLPVRNPDIRVSKKMKRDEGPRTARAVNAEEETDDGGWKASASTDKDVTASILPENEEEDADLNPCRTRDTTEDGAGDFEEPQLCHVPGGAWLQQTQVVLWKLSKNMDIVLSQLGIVEASQSALQKAVELNSAGVTQHEQQHTTLSSKVEDMENRSRWNNLWVLGVLKGAEGDDPCDFAVCLFRKTFPALSDWDMNSMTQRTHHFPFRPPSKPSRYPQVTLIYIGNLFLQQEIFQAATPKSLVKACDIECFVHSDFFHQTVVKCWELREHITALQKLGAYVSLMETPTLRIREDGQTFFCYGGQKVQCQP
ncbi:hypothetical protein NDU88_008055 [Pleurodeles waltl]|uniref:Uncharacterized protein n=1 Tax=Pleurodeles waltl TaxID=8319 RepID=A0AAV7NUU8_PLEWA|nr:hypothetical protein NDU88_008055 [Pleurodeles waltl]